MIAEAETVKLKQQILNEDNKQRRKYVRMFLLCLRMFHTSLQLITICLN